MTSIPSPDCLFVCALYHFILIHQFKHGNLGGRYSPFSSFPQIFLLLNIHYSWIINIILFQQPTFYIIETIWQFFSLSTYSRLLGLIKKNMEPNVYDSVNDAGVAHSPCYSLTLQSVMMFHLKSTSWHYCKTLDRGALFSDLYCLW